MIVLYLFKVFVSLITLIIGTVMNLVGAPISGTFSIPTPLFFVAELTITASLGVGTGLLIWFAWRQVKA